ncbi:MAG: hypothetical protein ABI317_06245 [Gaiellales bacterium]
MSGLRRVLIGLGLAAACLAPIASAAMQKPDVPAIRSALRARLGAQQLRVRHVVCIPNGRVFRGQEIVRCNVDFGEPHITAYCSVLIGGRLLTQFDTKKIPCGRDKAGDKDIIITSG